MNLQLEPYLEQTARWPAEGRHILAQFDAESVVVYQAYAPDIGRFAAEHGRFGGRFSLDRMSWIKPNFLWMMFRCGWARKEGQETVLAVRLRRTAFDAILRQAVPSSFDRELYESPEAWQADVQRSEVRLQWDPDHDPAGSPLARRAVQLGLRGPVLAAYAEEWLLGIEDISEWVREQEAHVRGRAYERLQTPREEVYPVTDPEAVRRLGIGRSR